MVACKILCECQLLYGSPFLFDELMQLVATSGVRGKLNALQTAAETERRDAERILLEPDACAKNHLHLFFTREEGEEIY